MKTACTLFIISMTLLCQGCNNRQKGLHTSVKPAQHQPTKADSNRNDSIAFAQVEKLPEYKHILAYFDTANKDSTHHISVLLEAEPAKGTNYYQLEVGEDSPERFADMELFYVDAKTMVVHHVDKETGNQTTLEQWRKSGNDDWFK